MGVGSETEIAEPEEEEDDDQVDLDATCEEPGDLLLFSEDEGDEEEVTAAPEPAQVDSVVATEFAPPDSVIEEPPEEEITDVPGTCVSVIPRLRRTKKVAKVIETVSRPSQAQVIPEIRREGRTDLSPDFGEEGQAEPKPVTMHFVVKHECGKCWSCNHKRYIQTSCTARPLHDTSKAITIGGSSFTVGEYLIKRGVTPASIGVLLKAYPEFGPTRSKSQWVVPILKGIKTKRALDVLVAALRQVCANMDYTEDMIRAVHS